MRCKLDRRQYRPMIEWIHEVRDSQLADIKLVPVGYDDLSGVFPDAADVSIEDEIAWLTERLRAERVAVSAYLAMKAQVESASLAGEVEAAVDRLKIIQSTFGVSLWSVQLRLALEQQAGGLTRQKQYSSEVRSVYRRGLLGFTTYHTSVRNEDRTTYSRFLDDIENRIRSHGRYDDATKTYARYRLKSEFPGTLDGLARILKIEQGHGLIDIYETYISVLQEIAKRGLANEGMSRAIVDCIGAVAIPDVRLAKVAMLLGPNVRINLPPRDASVADALFAGNAPKAARLGLKALRDGAADPWTIIYVGFALAHMGGRSTAPPNRLGELPRMIARVQNRSVDSSDAWSQTAKMTLNFCGLNVAAAIYELMIQLRRSAPDSPWQPWLISLNSSTLGIEDCPANSQLSEYVAQISGYQRAWALSVNPDASVTSWIERAFSAIGYINRGDFEEALSVLGTDADAWPEPMRPLHILISLHAHFVLGHRQKVIATIAGEGSRSIAHRHFLPIARSLAAYEWNDFKNTADQFAAPIALHMLWTAKETSTTLSQLRFATGSALRAAGVGRPSALSETVRRCTLHEFLYFLDEVCVPNVLDLTRLFKNTRELLEERLSICRALEELDPASAIKYEDEIVEIANQLALDEGLWIVDSTRIHVDSDALVRWAMRELSEDYDRIKDLVPIEIKGSQPFEDVLSELVNLTSQKVTADSEADAVLISIAQRLAEEFLTNPSFGLDFYLSKRVRHQSFIGLIRGPLEFGKLITTRESEAGDYRRNDEWVDRFETLYPDERGIVDAALRDFASKFDAAIARTKDTYFHVRSPEFPQGLIFVGAVDRLVGFMRAIVQLDIPFRDYVRVTIPALWAMVQAPLGNIRTLITGELKRELSDEFDRVRSTIRATVGGDPAFIEFDAVIGRAASEVQAKLDEAAQWFVHADTASSQRRFTLSQILKVGLNAALKTQRDYSPVITEVAEGDIELEASNLIFVHDVLFAGLGNVRKHSGLKSPKINVVARFDAELATLHIEVTSDCKAGVRHDKAKQAEQIRKLIDAASYAPRTRIEGGSGFAKLAAVVSQSDRASLEFGFQDDGRFRLAVTYAVIRTTPQAV